MASSGNNLYQNILYSTPHLHRDQHQFHPNNISKNSTSTTDGFEFEESDIWNSNDQIQTTREANINKIRRSLMRKTPPIKIPSSASRAIKSIKNTSSAADSSYGSSSTGGTCTTAARSTDYYKVGVSSSLPVNIPDWSKIYVNGSSDIERRSGDDYSCFSRQNELVEDIGEELDEEDDRLPPHEYVARQLARSRIVAFSVHEGVGRTLKGRDLRRVRNAIWKQTGFED